MLNRIFTGLRARVIALVLVGLIPALTILWLNFVQEGREASANAQQSALAFARLVATDYDEIVEQTERVLAVLSDLPEIASSTSACSATLNRFLRRYPLYANFGVIGPDGLLVCSAVPTALPIDLSDRPYFRRAVQTGAFSVGDYQVGRATRRSTINFALPLFDGTGLSGVLFAALDLRALGPLSGGRLLPPGTAVTLVDRTGLVLTRYPGDEDWVGKPIPEPLLFQAMMTVSEGTGEFPGPGGTPRLFGWTALKSPAGRATAYVAVGIPREVVYAGERRVATRTTFGLVLIAITTVGVGWVLGRIFLIRPMDRLVDAATRVARGERTDQVDVRERTGELGKLAVAFDAMTLAVTERENRVKQSEENFRLLFRDNPHPMWVYDAQTLQYLEVNDAACALYGYTRDEFLRMRITEIRAVEEVPRLLRTLREMKPGLSHPGIRQHLTKDARTISVDITRHSIEFDGHDAVLALLRDVSEAVQAQAELVESRFRLEALSRRLVDLQEAERRHIARELHDEIGQLLTGLKLIIELASHAPQTAQTRLHEALDLVNQLLAQVRTLSLNLRPPMLEDLGLLPTLSWFIERYEAMTRIGVRLDADNLPRFDPRVEIAAFRIVQEALTNVARHSGAAEAKVSVSATDDVLQIDVEDLGKGFDPGGRTTGGLLGMIERAQFLDGTLTVRSAPGGGTSIRAVLPVRDLPAEAAG